MIGTRYYDLAGLVSLTLFRGFSYPALEFGLTSFPPLLLAAFRFDLAGLLLLGFVAVRSDHWVPRTRDDLVSIAAGGVVLIAVGNGAWTVGQGLTTSALSGVMVSISPLLTAGFSWILLPEDRLSAGGVAGLAVGFGGALLIMLPDGPLRVGPGLLGKGLIFAGIASVALGGVLIRWADPELPVAAQSAWSMVVGAAFLHVFSIAIRERPADVTPTTEGLLALAYLAVLSGLVANLVYYSLLQRRSAIEISLTTYVVPVVAATAGWALFGDPVTPSMIGGFLVVLVGFGLLKRQTLRREVEQVGF
ncbi:EamA family transporter [Haloarculaceae archaeon H-GB1-1]|nr:EamA family transporter [Haloarculaceae archaeon H-GB1-1]